ncbi:MAG: hypothetical protein SP1CHLAM54_09330 [Chlamydiia bacterium]|nr:hypothetical protein [Chlamydiia bacterium]MCH9615839.1 hypothetical protein [Chlamydiia bacterium]MCH9628758.1 hypothetical protein [Chlamydiia bacterium]
MAVIPDNPTSFITGFISAFYFSLPEAVTAALEESVIDLASNIFSSARDLIRFDSRRIPHIQMGVIGTTVPGRARLMALVTPQPPRYCLPSVTLPSRSL